MKRKLSIFVVIVLVMAVMAGCATNKTAEMTESGYYKGSTNDAAPAYTPSPVNGEFGRQEDTAYTNVVKPSVTQEKKIVKFGSMTIEVTNYDEAYNDLFSILGESGYLESSNIWKTPRYVNGEKVMLTNANLVIRIDEARFESFIKELENVGLIINQSTNSSDISYMYYDTEARVQLKLDEKVRLEQYLREIEDAKVYFEVQSRITEVIYEIEQLKGNILRWDNQVSYASINITINEIAPDEEPSVKQPKGFFGRIWENMVDGVEFLGDMIILFAGAIPVLILLAAFIVLIVKLAGRKKNSK